MVLSVLFHISWITLEVYIQLMPSMNKWDQQFASYYIIFFSPLICVYTAIDLPRNQYISTIFTSKGWWPGGRALFL